GIFLFRADRYLDELDKYMPDMVDACKNSMEGAVVDVDFVRPDALAFRSSPSDSIDYAVMEKTSRAAMVPLDAGWSDVGSWAALHDVSTKDGRGNTFSGDVVSHNCEGSFISAQSRLVAAVGLRDIIVVEDKDTVLVARKEDSQDVKELVEELTRQGREET